MARKWTPTDLPCERTEYRQRVQKVRAALAGAGIEALLVSEPLRVTADESHLSSLSPAGSSASRPAVCPPSAPRHQGEDAVNKDIIYTGKAPAPGAYSQAVRYGNLIFVSGQTSDDPVTHAPVRDSVEEQTQRILDHIGYILEAAGSGLDKVLKCNVYLSDWENKERMNAVYKKVFAHDPPARICMAVKGLDSGLDVEIDCIAGV